MAVLQNAVLFLLNYIQHAQYSTHTSFCNAWSSAIFSDLVFRWGSKNWIHLSLPVTLFEKLACMMETFSTPFSIVLHFFFFFFGGGGGGGGGGEYPIIRRGTSGWWGTSEHFFSISSSSHWTLSLEKSIELPICWIVAYILLQFLQDLPYFLCFLI